MTGAPYTNPMHPPPVTGRSFRRIGLTLVCLAVLILVGIAGVLKMQGRSVQTALGEKPATPWKSQTVYPPLQEKAVAQAPPPADDKEAQRLAALERQMQQLLAGLEELKKRKGSTTTVVQPPAQEKKHPHAPPLYIANKLEGITPTSTVPEYTLAPGATKLPCVVETKIVSDVEGYFTCRVTTNVYDTATGHHLLVPQGSTVLGNDQANELLYGSERMETVSLKLALPDGRTVDLGRAPVTDQQGGAGLTGDVNQHYGRLLAAVLIQGVLKGGTAAMSQAMTNAAGAGQVTSGLASGGNQATQKVTQPMLNTRPTITVAAGQLAHVLLLKELKLPALWQGSAPHAPTAASTPAAAGR